MGPLCKNTGVGGEEGEKGLSSAMEESNGGKSSFE